MRKEKPVNEKWIFNDSRNLWGDRKDLYPYPSFYLKTTPSKVAGRWIVARDSRGRQDWKRDVKGAFRNISFATHIRWLFGNFLEENFRC